VWIDNVIAILFGVFIIYTGFKLMKESVNNLLDEADYEKLNQLIQILYKNRKTKWIDFHNLRILKYGSHLHVDAHITLPWYENLENSHHEVSAVEYLVKQHFDDEVELFIHADPCINESCTICIIKDCKQRRKSFVKSLEWNLENLLPDKKHSA
jgi:divalent metal cation (Fe/Co/Zn/Cd) transporter